MWSIQQIAENEWQVLRDGQPVEWAPGRLSFERYDLALAYIAAQLTTQATLDVADGTAEGDGLLPERWVDAGGIFFSEPTGDGRDFTQCQWTWRDPGEVPVPLMLQTSTDIGHFGAELAGFVEMLSMSDGTGHASGRFYDSERGRQFRDMLLGGRKFGVSVDPGAIDVDFRCVEEDDDGWCVEEEIDFLAYQVIGLTGTPFAGFERAAIQLEGAVTAAADSDEGEVATIEPITGHDFEDDGNGYCAVCVSESDDGDCQQICGAVEEAHVTEEETNDGDDAGDSMSAAAAVLDLQIPLAPPSQWLSLPEPEAGQAGGRDLYGADVSEILIEQPDGGLAVPLQILDNGLVYGHIARWGQRHVGFPGDRVTPPESAAAYAHFHVGHIVCDDGEDVACGTLVVGSEHAQLRGLSAGQARDYYAHAGFGWANVRVSNGQYGVWACGVLRPDVTAEQVRVLRSLALSGDWRRIGGSLELIGVLAVSVPGFPLARDIITASGLETITAAGRVQGAVSSGETEALIAAGMVYRCSECARRAAAAAAAGRANDLGAGVERRLDRIEHTLQTLERRTRHLRSAARDDIARAIRLPAPSDNGNTAVTTS